MKLISPSTITVKRVSPTPSPYEVDGENRPLWPEFIIAHVALSVTDDLTLQDETPHDLTFMTRLLMTDASEGLRSVEQRALQKLAHELRALADSLDAMLTPA